MGVNYNDERFTDVERDREEALTENEQLYGGMVAESDKYYQDQQEAAQEWADKQTEIQNEQTDFAIEQIEQQKEQAEKDYIKEQSGAYVDWQKQSGAYGANAEAMAAQGMTGTGYSESSQVSMYNTYQNRVATAREAFSRAVLNYDNAIKEARLQNNAALAEIAYQALQTQLQLALESFQYKNSLLIQQANMRLEIDNMYYSRYQDVLDQINQENALAEEMRQFNASLAEEQRQFNATLAWQKAQAAGGGGGGGSSSGGKRITKSSGGSGTSTKSNKQAVNIADKEKGSNGGTSKQPEPNLRSVLDLGYGPISPARLNELVKSGVIIEYEKNGQLYYKKSPYANKQSMLFNGVG